MRFYSLLSCALLPAVALAGTISFASNTECSGGTEQTSDGGVCMEAPSGLSGSFYVSDMGGCSELTMYDGGSCDDNRMTYDELGILKFCLAPKYSFTHYSFDVC
jgi:hypothetical protein